MRRRLGPIAAALLIALAACGGGDDPDEALRETAANLGEIRSGDLSFEFLLTPREQAEAGQVGVKIDGAFELRGEGELPTLDVTYTRIAGATRTSARLQSDGQVATVVQGGERVELEPAQSRPLADAVGAEGLGGLGVDPSRWIDDAQLEDGPTLDGQATDRIAGDLDATALAADLIATAERSGAGGLADADAEQLEQAVRSSTVELLTGREDRLLRRLSVSVTFDVPPELRGEVPGATALDLDMRLAIEDPN